MIDMTGASCYLVGGAVRDFLLKIEGGDRDYVVVGQTPEKMLAMGFKAVGADFPVFIHPQTGEEYALARTERKSGQGYLGFTFYSAPTVTLEEDLKRRDLTINAMAMDSDGNIIDYYGGQEDLNHRCLRHISPAFIEDPVRILRVARFAAVLPDFEVAEETMLLMQQMVLNGEIDHLQKERVWQELSRGLIAKKPSRMLSVLDECGALSLLLPEVAALKGVPERLDYHPEGESFIHTAMVIDAASVRGGNIGVCFSCLLHDIGKAKTLPEILPSHHGHEKHSAQLVKAIVGRMRLPKNVAQLALLVAAEHGNVHKILEMRSSSVVDLLMRLDAIRRRQRFEDILRACEADFYYLPQRADQPYLQGQFLRAALEAIVNDVDSGRIVQDLREKGEDELDRRIPEAIRYARIKVVNGVRSQLSW